MNKILQIAIVLVLVMGITSCSRKYRIDEADYSLIPYKGNENLVLKSSEHKYDTIFITGIDRYLAGSDPLAFFPDRYEIHRLNCIISDPNYDRYLEGKKLIELRASSDETFIWFEIAMKESWFLWANYLLKIRI